MAQKKRSTNWRVWHRWLSLVFGLQMVVWAISGSYMVFFDLDYIHGDHLVKDISQSLPEHSEIAELDELLARFPGTQSVSLETLWLDNKLHSVYKLENGEGPFVVDAESLNVIELQEHHIRELANRYYALGEPEVESVVYMTENPPTEISAALLPVWQVNYDDFGNTSLYLSEATGDLLGRVDVFWLDFVRLAVFCSRNEECGLVILNKRRVTKSKAPPDEPFGQRVAGISTALSLVHVE